MQEVSLTQMTRELCRMYYSGFESDPAIYMDMSGFKPFVYSDAWADAYFDRQVDMQRVYLAVMLNGAPVGEILFKNIDLTNRECTLSAHLQNDRVKGRGIGAAAEKLALKYAFDTLGLSAVNADTVLKNTRSQRVLEKVGFTFVRQEGIFKYYRCVKSATVSFPERFMV